MKYQNILIIMLGGIGNLILLVPSLRALRDRFPQSKITLLAGEPTIDDVIAADKLVDAVALYDRRTSHHFLDIFHFIHEMRKENFDLALVASSTNAFKASLLTFLMGIPHRIGENIGGKGLFYTQKIPFQRGTHELDGMINLVKILGCDVKEVLPRISLFGEDDEIAGKFLAKKGLKKGEYLIGIHAGCGYMQTFKRWPKERFAEVADDLIRKYKAKIVLTGGPQEIELVREVEELMQETPINAAGKLTIRQTAAIIQRCCLFISNDSGLAHVATAVNTPLIVLFGNTEIWRIVPRGKEVYLIKKETNDKTINSIDLILEEEVFQIAEKILTHEKQSFTCHNPA